MPLLDNNTVKCWGGNRYGQLGLNHRNVLGSTYGEMGNNLPYVNLGSARFAKDISVGYHHACVLLDNNKIKCWGYNRYGTLGQGHTNNIGDDANEMENLDAIDLGEGRTAKRVAAGQHHTCAILDNNDLVCWGDNEFYPLGIDLDLNNRAIGDASNEMGSNLVATHLVSQDAIDMGAGSNFTCVIRKNGSLYCWGENDYGQLGLEHTDTMGYMTTQPVDVEVDLGSNLAAKTVELGRYHTCSLLDNDDIKCWGRNNHGQLGQGDISARGDEADEMGDHLAVIDLVPDMADLVWEGYSSNTITYGDNAPSLRSPSGEPAGDGFCLQDNDNRCLYGCCEFGSFNDSRGWNLQCDLNCNCCRLSKRGENV